MQTCWISPREKSYLERSIGPVPEQYEIRLSPHQRYYLVDHGTQMTWWTDDLEDSTISTDWVSSDPGDGFGPLPRHWIKIQSVEFEVVFINLREETETKFDPRAYADPPDYVSSIQSLPGEEDVLRILEASSRSGMTATPQNTRTSPTVNIVDRTKAVPPSLGQTQLWLENQAFSYGCLGDGEIRLLGIQHARRSDAPLVCTMRNVALSTDSIYDALSYTWGNRENMGNISVNGQPFAMRENGLAALRRLRGVSNKVEIWVDAVCINQNDNAEKSRQIALMGRIFEQAQQVCIWLGEETTGSNVGMNRMAGQMSDWTNQVSLTKMYWKYGWLSPNILPKLYHGNGLEFWNMTEEFQNGEVRELLCRPWWNRVWTMQEVIVARKTMLMCGQKTIRWEKMSKWTDFVQDQYGTGANYVIAPFGLDSRLDDFYRRLDEFRELWKARKLDSSIYDLLYSFRHLDCFDQRDRIFGFLGMTKFVSELDFTPSYNLGVSEVYRQFAKAMIRFSKTLDILNFQRQWKGAATEDVPAYAYSINDQAKFHDPEAFARYSKQLQRSMAWVRLPQGWERREDGKKVTFYNWNTNQVSSTSPLKDKRSLVATHVGERKQCPPGWTKTWDNLGRAHVAFNPRGQDHSPHQAIVDLDELPSWVPNWARRTPWDPMPLLDHNNNIYSAHRSIPYILDTSERDLELVLKGVYFDHIVKIAEPWHPDSNSFPLSRHGVEELEAWEKLALAPVDDCPYAAYQGRSEALWRTHLADGPWGHGASPMDELLVECWYDRDSWAGPRPTYRDLIGLSIQASIKVYIEYQSTSVAGMFGVYKGLFIRRYDDLVAAGVLSGDVSKEDMVKKWTKDITKPATPPELYGPIARRIFNVCANRVMFVTKKGYIGLAPWNARSGDRVYCLHGAKTPFLLRPCRDQGTFALVGETYVHGIMGGEAFDLCKDVEKVRLT